MAILTQMQQDMRNSREEAKVQSERFFNVVTKHHQELASKMEEISARFGTLESRVNEMTSEQSGIKNDMEQMKTDLNYLQQKQLDLNLVIKGMPEIKNENPEQTHQLMQKLLDCIGVDINCVTSSKRIGKKGGSTPRIILFTVDQKENKHGIITAKRANQVVASDIFDNASPNQAIYVDEQLTRQNGHLLKMARKLKEDSNTEFVWVKDGTVYVKQTKESQAVAIRNEHDLSSFGKSASGKSGNKRKNDNNGTANQRAPKQSKTYAPAGVTTRSNSNKAAEVTTMPDVAETSGGGHMVVDVNTCT